MSMTYEDLCALNPGWWDRLWAKIDTSGGEGECWPWTGASSGKGQGGMLSVKKPPGASSTRHSVMPAHALVWAGTHGKTPWDVGEEAGEHHQISHLCHNPACCNPDHLECVTPRENKDRSIKDGRPQGGRREVSQEVTEAIWTRYPPRPSVQQLCQEYGLTSTVVNRLIAERPPEW